MARGRMARVGLGAQELEEGKREAGGLAGARLGCAQEVFAGEYNGNGLRLDGGGRGVALFRDCAEELRLQPERVKRTNKNFSCTRPV